MRPDRLAELRERAQAAHQGEWTNTHIFDGEEVITYMETNHVAPAHVAVVRSQLDAMHIAAFSPTTALDLLDEIADAREVIGVLTEALRFYRRADNWITKSNEPCSPIVADTGSTASKAIESTREKRENI